MKAIQIQEFGGAGAFEYVELPDPVPGPGEILVEVARVGVNFADTHAVRDQYVAAQALPLIPGVELAGRTADGRRVAALPPSGAYAQRVAVPAAAVTEIPDAVSDEQAAAALVQGLTALALVGRCGRVEPGETVVVEGAAGGTGGLLVQVAKRAGARVIGLASSEAKREQAAALGADATADSRAEELTAAILEANGGRPVDVVLHMSGGEAFDAELAALAPLGRLVVFGISSRERREVSNAALLKGSKAVVGFWLWHLLARPELCVPMIDELLGALADGELDVRIGGTYPLSEAARAHADLTSRRTAGKLLLDPSS